MSIVVLALSWFCLGLVAIVCWRRARRLGGSKPVRRDTRSWYDIALQALGFAAVWTFQRPADSAFIPGWPSGAALVAAVSMASALAGAAFAGWAIITLDRQYAVSAQVREGAKLITSGPFAHVRNPVYVGLATLLLATGLVVSVWQAVAVGETLYLAGTYVRARREAVLLSAVFGASYADYAARVPLLIPRLRAATPPDLR